MKKSLKNAYNKRTEEKNASVLYFYLTLRLIMV